MKKPDRFEKVSYKFLDSYFHDEISSDAILNLARLLRSVDRKARKETHQVYYD